MPVGAWWDKHDPNIFFPRAGKLNDVDKARWTCFTCTVQPQCRQYQIDTDSRYGIWAGDFYDRHKDDETEDEDDS